MTSEDSNNVSNSKGYNPYKRISDRVEMIQNQVVVQRSSYDKLNKDYLGRAECDREAELSRLNESATTTMILAAELYSAVQTEVRQGVSS